MDMQREPQQPERTSKNSHNTIPKEFRDTIQNRTGEPEVVPTDRSQKTIGANRTFVPFVRSYARETSVIVGVMMIVLGLLGFVVPNLLGAHLSIAHNTLFIAVGALALWFGTDSERTAKAFSYVCAVFFAGIGVLGFVMGAPGIGSVANTAQDANLWTVVAGSLQFGTVDHVIHLLIGAAFLAGALMKQKEYRSL